MSNYYKRTKPEPPTCPHNDHVVCYPTERHCSTCGFDPAVAKARLEEIRRKLGIPVPDQKEEE